MSDATNTSASLRFPNIHYHSTKSVYKFKLNLGSLAKKAKMQYLRNNWHLCILKINIVLQTI